MTYSSKRVFLKFKNYFLRTLFGIKSKLEYLCRVNGSSIFQRLLSQPKYFIGIENNLFFQVISPYLPFFFHVCYIYFVMFVTYALVHNDLRCELKQLLPFNKKFSSIRIFCKTQFLKKPCSIITRH